MHYLQILIYPLPLDKYLWILINFSTEVMDKIQIAEK